MRYAGEDVAEGDLLVEAGTALGPRHLGLLASVGPDRRARASAAARGDRLHRLRAARARLRALDDDSIYDGNSFLLAAAARRAGAVPYRVGPRARPSPRRSSPRSTTSSRRADVVVTSGGISMGDFDVVKAALTPARHRVVRRRWRCSRASRRASAPARPASGDVPFFALPGNPVSSYLSFEMFVRPALRRMMGLTPESRRAGPRPADPRA